MNDILRGLGVVDRRRVVQRREETLTDDQVKLGVVETGIGALLGLRPAQDALNLLDPLHRTPPPDVLWTDLVPRLEPLKFLPDLADLTVDRL